MIDAQVPPRELSLVVIVAYDPARDTELSLSLQSAGWRVNVVTPQGLDEFRDTVPGLLLVDCADEQACREALDVIGSTIEPTVPIITLEPDANAGLCTDRPEIDARFDRTLPHPALIEALASWQPVSLEPTRRIAAMLGDGPIAGMIERLARRLEAALIDLDAGTIDKGEAHRLAGLCGTLGFGQAHAAWLDLSVGKTDSLADVRRTTRLTLAAIARGL